MQNPHAVDRRLATLNIDVAAQTRRAARITKEKHALDGVVFFVFKLRQGVDGGSGALRVALQDEAFVWIFLESRLDLFDNLVSLACAHVTWGRTSSVPGLDICKSGASYTVLYWQW